MPVARIPIRRCCQVIAAAIFLVVAGQAQGDVAIKVGLNIQGATLGIDSGAIPPDADGVVGPNHYVQLVNGSYKVFSKTNGALLQSMSDVDFWTAAGLDLTGLAVSDPRVFYDPSVQRWFASQVSYDPNSLTSDNFVVGISATADPTGAWKAVTFIGGTNGQFADFPTVGLDANGYYIAGNIFDSNGNFLGVEVVSLPKADLLGPTPVATNASYSGLFPAETWGFAVQPVVSYFGTNSAARAIAIGNEGGDLQPHNTLAAFVISNASTTNAVFTNLSNIIVPTYSVPINPTQPDGLSESIDDGDARISAAVYQAGSFIYAVHGTEINSRAAVQWFKLDAGSLTLVESGTITDANLDLFYPSIAANSNGLVVIGFNGCSTNSFVSSYAVAGQTINGSTVFGGKVLLQAGAGNYEVPDGSGYNRWGDYSATSLDPANPNVFWTIQEIPSSANIWSVQITQLLVEPVLNVSVAGTNAIVSWPTNSTGFTLLSNTNLLTTNWTAVSPQPTILGSQFVVTNNSAGTLFYRLAQ